MLCDGVEGNRSRMKWIVKQWTEVKCPFLKNLLYLLNSAVQWTTVQWNLTILDNLKCPNWRGSLISEGEVLLMLTHKLLFGTYPSVLNNRDVLISGFWNREVPLYTIIVKHNIIIVL